MTITIIYDDERSYDEFDYEIDDSDIQRFLIELLEDDFEGPDYIGLPEHLPVDPDNSGEPYTIEEYAEEYMDDLMDIRWYYDYVYDRVIDEFGDKIGEAYRDAEQLRKDPYSYYGVKRSDF